MDGLHPIENIYENGQTLSPKTGELMEIINRTHHPIHLYKDGQVMKSFDPVAPQLRLNFQRTRIRRNSIGALAFVGIVSRRLLRRRLISAE